MSLALIEESAKEIRRLAIAGSPLAVGDFRLKKLIAPLEQAGAKVPVFAQVAKAITDLVNGKEGDSPARLLSLSTLLNAILYTQGQTGAEAALCELDQLATPCSSTRTSARLLRPLVEALTSTGGGRFETVKAALERGAFNDIRLVQPALRALDDIYPELADLVADKILPTYGPGIVPLLRQQLDLKGKKSNARRLAILHRFDPAGTVDLCKKALEEGSVEVKISAIECLGQHEECLALVMEQGNSKNKVVRSAALKAMAQHDREEITQLFIGLIQGGKALDSLALPFRAVRNRQVVDALLGEGRRVFDLLLKKEEAQIPRFLEVLDCLDQRKDAETENFILNCFNQGDKIAKLKAPKNFHLAGADIVERLASVVYLISSPRSLEAILARRDALPASAFSYVVRSALRTWPAERFYQEFAALLQEKKGAAKEKGEALRGLIWAARGSEEESEFDVDAEESPNLRNLKWDPRWLEAAIQAEHVDIVCLLAKPSDKKAHGYLVKQLDKINAVVSPLIIESLARCHYPGITDVFLDAVGKGTKRAKTQSWEWLSLVASAKHLPPDDFPKLEAFAAKLDEKLVDPFLEAIQPLRPAKPSAQP